MNRCRSTQCAIGLDGQSCNVTPSEIGHEKRLSHDAAVAWHRAHRRLLAEMRQLTICGYAVGMNETCAVDTVEEVIALVHSKPHGEGAALMN